LNLFLSNFVKQDLRFAELLDTVTIVNEFTSGDKTPSLVVKGAKSIFTSAMDNGTIKVTARFADGSTAAQVRCEIRE
jgi:hypothetical protein